MSEVKIARFIDIEACKSIFSENSTFVLRSPEHYIRLYETSGGITGDRNEGCAKKVDGGTVGFTSFVMSCWTKLKETEPTHDEWNIFKREEPNIVAIVSTPSKVCEFLYNAFEMNEEYTKRRFPFLSLKHDKVKYDEKVRFDHTNNIDVVPFTKGPEYYKEEEYRFVLCYSKPPLIDSYIFSSGIVYMEKCFVNPEISKENKIELLSIVGNARAGYGDFSDKDMCDIIANADILFR